MQISNDKKIKDLQKDFKSIFPYLKIEFFWMPHKDGETSDEAHKLDSEMKLETIRQSRNSGYLTLYGNMTVGELERKMRDLFGLHIQVYRKEYKKWRQTWVTDSWTLEEQNRRSRIMGEKGTTLQEIRSKITFF